MKRKTLSPVTRRFEMSGRSFVELGIYRGRFQTAQSNDIPKPDSDLILISAK